MMQLSILNRAMRDFLLRRADISVRRPESIGRGWVSLLEQLCRQLDQLGWNKEVLQIKEKCGHLCFYIRLKSQPSKHREAIRMVISFCRKIDDCLCTLRRERITTTGWLDQNSLQYLHWIVPHKQGSIPRGSLKAIKGSRLTIQIVEGDHSW